MKSLFEKYSLDIIGVGVLDRVPNDSKYGLDIGGTLIKLVYTLSLRDEVLFEYELEHMRKNFFDVEDLKRNKKYAMFCLIAPVNKKIELQIGDVLGFLKERGLYRPNSVPMTGGGSVKFRYLLETNYQLKVVRFDEMQSIVNGCFELFGNLSTGCPQQAYYYSVSKGETILIKMDSRTRIFPSLVVSVGSGVSIIRVESQDQFERVSGTRFGGGTVFGISKLLGVENYGDLLNLYSSYERKNGQQFGESGAPEGCFFKEFVKDASMLPSSSSQYLGEVELRESFVHNIVNMMYSDLSYLICLISSNYKYENIVFCGNYVSNHHKIIIKSIRKYSYMLNDKINIFFHYLDGFFGAIGAYLSHKCN
ncbi:pantothenate kinase 4 [Cryptosporidium canis]|uniref:Pantothenate kinase 4 n=1 Tax=Cryptosporidium canis TaxID=195482 RepID=A0ABQ8PAZ2_9CRYT|nr:pantothenate kinase 4 [Cryptosporidium canis]KAJ1614176.1 pantothenate kinase 4 [Cryptosporidium canis]